MDFFGGMGGGGWGVVLQNSYHQFSLFLSFVILNNAIIKDHTNVYVCEDEKYMIPCFYVMLKVVIKLCCLPSLDN